MDQSFTNGQYYMPGKRVFLYFFITKILLFVFAFIIICIGAFLLPANITNIILPIITIIGIVFCLIALVISYIDYKSVKFMFDDFSFHIERGILSKNEIAIPYKQIQNVNHAQSLGEKMWGIARVAVETAGTDERGSTARSEGILPVLDTALAISLEKELLRRASENS